MWMSLADSHATVVERDAGYRPRQVRRLGSEQVSLPTDLEILTCPTAFAGYAPGHSLAPGAFSCPALGLSNYATETVIVTHVVRRRAYGVCRRGCRPPTLRDACRTSQALRTALAYSEQAGRNEAIPWIDGPFAQDRFAAPKRADQSRPQGSCF